MALLAASWMDLTPPSTTLNHQTSHCVSPQLTRPSTVGLLQRQRWWTTKNGGSCLMQYYRYTSLEGKMVTFLHQQLCEHWQKIIISVTNLASKKVVQAAQKLVHTAEGCAPSVQLCILYEPCQTLCLAFGWKGKANQCHWSLPHVRSRCCVYQKIQVVGRSKVKEKLSLTSTYNGHCFFFGANLCVLMQTFTNKNPDTPVSQNDLASPPACRICFNGKECIHVWCTNQLLQTTAVDEGIVCRKGSWT